MSIDTVIILIALIGVFVAIFTIIHNQTNNFNKKFDAIKDELTDFKISTNERLSKVEVRLERLEMKFGIVNERQDATNQKIDTHIVSTNEQFKELKTENKEIKIETQSIISKILKKFEPQKELNVLHNH